MSQLKLFTAKYGSHNVLRLVYILLAILMMTLAAGAPDAIGGGPH